MKGTKVDVVDAGYADVDAANRHGCNEWYGEKSSSFARIGHTCTHTDGHAQNPMEPWQTSSQVVDGRHGDADIAPKRLRHWCFTSVCKTCAQNIAQVAASAADDLCDPGKENTLS
jgi:hypothetical protein